MYCPILNKFGFSRQILIEVSNFKLQVIPSSGNWAEVCEQASSHDEANRFFSSFPQKS
jgi:hypothetical protein